MRASDGRLVEITMQTLSTRTDELVFRYKTIGVEFSGTNFKSCYASVSQSRIYRILRWDTSLRGMNNTARRTRGENDPK